MQPDVSHSRANFRSRFQAFPRSSLWTVVLQFLSCFHLEIQNDAPTLPQSQTKNDVIQSSWNNAIQSVIPQYSNTTSTNKQEMKTESVTNCKAWQKQMENITARLTGLSKFFQCNQGV